MAELDITRAPLGTIAAQALVAAVAEQGDLAERHYLELKSTLDLSKKQAKEKIAKFILGAANRMPDVAASAFEGYGVMIIGVAQGAITGVPPVEMMEISTIVQKYLGASGPHWDVIWVPIDGTPNQVLLVIVDPPKYGQGPFVCRANGESLTDGRVYIRDEGQTREAKSEELDLLIQRGSIGTQVEVDFQVEVLGEIAFVTLDEERTIDEYVSAEREWLINAMLESKQQAKGVVASSTDSFAQIDAARAAFLDLTLMFNQSNGLKRCSEKDYRESIDQWEDDFRSAWTTVIPKIAASQLRPVCIRVANRTTTFFHDVEVKLDLDGDIFVCEYVDPEEVENIVDRDLPEPPLEWGQTRRSLDFQHFSSMSHLCVQSAPQYFRPSISYKNGSPMVLSLNVGDLRPRGTYESVDEEIVLLVKDRSLKSIHGTWELTARDHNDVYTGEIDIPVAGTRDLTDVARQILRLETENE